MTPKRLAALGLLFTLSALGCSGSSGSSADEVTCTGGATACSGACVDTTTDAANCGACGNVCTAGEVCQASECTRPVAYVAVTLTNDESTATPAPFHQKLVVPSSTYASHLASDWSNVVFTTGAPTGTNSLQAWVESNPTSSGDTLVWVNLPDGIAASSSATIYMNFMGTALSASGPTGEAPQLSDTYAAYDNGAQVFGSYYENFAGTTLPATLTSDGDNRIDTVSNGLSMSWSSGWDFLSPTSAFSPATWFELDATAARGSYPCLGVAAGGASSSDSYFAMLDGYSYYWGSYSGGSATAGGVMLSAGQVLGVSWVSSSSQVWHANYVETPSNYSKVTLPASVYYSFGGIKKDDGALSVQWARVRAYPPAGVMPTASFGAVATW